MHFFSACAMRPVVLRYVPICAAGITGHSVAIAIKDPVCTAINPPASLIALVKNAVTYYILAVQLETSAIRNECN